MHWDILDKKRISLLKRITHGVDIGEYYMAGGTALSLQLRLRKSVDFDFFVPHKFNPHSLYAQLKDICPDDMAAMKALAIGSRGAVKDFFDLYQIYHRTDYDTHTLVHDLYSKYGEHANLSYVGMGLNYFEEAEQEKLPETYVKYDWEEIKNSSILFSESFLMK